MALPLTKNRIQSIDLLKGVVMILMALDHIRDYVHISANFFEPSDPTQTTLPIFFTRLITHFCAPTFSFLAGVSAFMVGKRKNLPDLSIFLLKRGLWLVLVELVIINFGWYFDVYFRSPILQVIWVLGISMIVLAALIHLPKKAILLFSCIVIFGHNLLDNLHFEGNVLWSLLHERAVIKFSDTYRLYIEYPIIPWVAVMSLGYYFGSFYDTSFDTQKRKKLFNTIGLGAILLFFILRWSNLYGNLVGWIHYETATKELISFFNLTKYPPSLLYLLLTLGGSFLFLGNMEQLKGKIVDFFCTFGRVPFFFYILHLYLIHVIALFLAEFSGFGWRVMILPDWTTEVPALKGYGFDFWVVFVVWFAVVAMLYPLCKWFDNYKQMHKEKEWLSYL